MRIDRAILFALATSARFEAAARVLPWGERLAWRAASRYVAGTTAADAFDLARELGRRGVGSSIDLFGELVTDATVADRGLADRLGATAQVNLRSAPRDMERLIEAGVHVRLVKGALRRTARTSAALRRGHRCRLPAAGVSARRCGRPVRAGDP